MTFVCKQNKNILKVWFCDKCGLKVIDHIQICKNSEISLYCCGLYALIKCWIKNSTFCRVPTSCLGIWWCVHVQTSPEYKKGGKNKLLGVKTLKKNLLSSRNECPTLWKKKVILHGNWRWPTAWMHGTNYDIYFGVIKIVVVTQIFD